MLRRTDRDGREKGERTDSSASIHWLEIERQFSIVNHGIYIYLLSTLSPDVEDHFLLCLSILQKKHERASKHREHISTFCNHSMCFVLLPALQEYVVGCFAYVARYGPLPPCARPVTLGFGIFEQSVLKQLK